MKQILLCGVLTVLCFNAVKLASRQTDYITPSLPQTKDGSILRPTDASYAEALAFARFLESHRIVVKSIHASKLNGLFQGLHKAAFFKTDKGIVEVIFFPETRDAENVRVIEQQKDGRYLYSFAGLPYPNPGDGFDSPRPMYFQMHRTWFIVIDSKAFSDTLKSILNES